MECNASILSLKETFTFALRIIYALKGRIFFPFAKDSANLRCKNGWDSSHHHLIPTSQYGFAHCKSKLSYLQSMRACELRTAGQKWKGRWMWVCLFVCFACKPLPLHCTCVVVTRGSCNPCFEMSYIQRNPVLQSLVLVLGIVVRG